jgi:Cu/Ag efflux pump CusA
VKSVDPSQHVRYHRLELPGDALVVLGIAARNGIMLISQYQHLEREEGVPFGPGLVLQGAKERLAPILMTALATGLALIPLVWAGSIPGHEIEHPMAVVIMGGLITSTLLNLFALPALREGLDAGRLQRCHGLTALHQKE